LTQLETARACGISRSYISRIEKRALEKLRDALEAGGGEGRNNTQSVENGRKVEKRNRKKT
jgi:predicted DNA-binding protein (UPF0251 family)